MQKHGSSPPPTTLAPIASFFFHPVGGDEDPEEEPEQRHGSEGEAKPVLPAADHPRGAEDARELQEPQAAEEPKRLERKLLRAETTGEMPFRTLVPRQQLSSRTSAGEQVTDSFDTL